MSEAAPPLAMPRLEARVWSLDDAAAAHELYGDPQVVRHIGNELMADVSATRALLERVLVKCAGYPDGMGGWPLWLKGSDELVGVALLKPLPDGDGVPTDDIEIGWHLARSRWGQGYATEAGRALLAWGFEGLDLPVLHAVVEAPNQASCAVARRLGMDDRGTSDAWYGLELRHFALERDTWRRRRDAPDPSRRA